MDKNYLQGLNEAQKEAVLYTEGPLMIIAGAGSGKTKVLTHRMAHLLDQGVNPFQILALTFTNKAAQEMKERIEHLLANQQARNLYLGTFHSVFARILRAEAGNIGYPRDFTIYDTEDVKTLIKTLLAEMNLDDKIYKPNTMYHKISSLKNSLIMPQDYLSNPQNQRDDSFKRIPEFGHVYQKYVDTCFKNGAMDFDDLLLQMYRLLSSSPQRLYHYQHKFKYVLIDEYQDTNHLQYAIVKMMAAAHENICVVGDDAQSIYSFRGATIENILRFEKDYDNVKVIKLEQNYRSTQIILDAANATIKHNIKQIEKSLWTSNNQGDKINLVAVQSDNEEGRFVADAIAEQKIRNHFKNQDFAILYRTNAQSRAFEESLRRQNIPYKIYGGMSFYSRKEIKDFMAYLKFICNPNDDISLKRIINYPARGIGKTSLENLALAANEKGITMWEAITQAGEIGFKGNALQAFKEFETMVLYFRMLMGQNNAYDVAVAVGKNTKLVAELYQDKTVEGLVRYENVQAFLNSLKEFTENPNEDGELIDKTLSSYLQQISLFTDVEDKDTKDLDVVTLMTIHASKGLEFSNVFVVGLEEGLFPNQMSLQDIHDLEEERRLFYVAITRAKQKLWLTYANMRYQFGNLLTHEPSRFVFEIPKEFQNFEYAQKALLNPIFRQFKNTQQYPSQSAAPKANTNTIKSTPLTTKSMPTASPAAPQYRPSQNFVEAKATDIRVGQTIEHAKFGLGEVRNIEGSPNNPIASIQFQHGGLKKIVLNYAKMSIVSG